LNINSFWMEIIFDVVDRACILHQAGLTIKQKCHSSRVNISILDFLIL